VAKSKGRGLQTSYDRADVVICSVISHLSISYLFCGSAMPTRCEAICWLSDETMAE